LVFFDMALSRADDLFFRFSSKKTLKFNAWPTLRCCFSFSYNLSFLLLLCCFFSFLSRIRETASFFPCFFKPQNIRKPSFSLSPFLPLRYPLGKTDFFPQEYLDKCSCFFISARHAWGKQNFFSSVSSLRSPWFPFFFTR